MAGGSLLGAVVGAVVGTGMGRLGSVSAVVCRWRRFQRYTPDSLCTMQDLGDSAVAVTMPLVAQLFSWSVLTLTTSPGYRSGRDRTP